MIPWGYRHALQRYPRLTRVELVCATLVAEAHFDRGEPVPLSTKYLSDLMLVTPASASRAIGTLATPAGEFYVWGESRKARKAGHGMLIRVREGRGRGHPPAFRPILTPAAWGWDPRHAAIVRSLPEHDAELPAVRSDYHDTAEALIAAIPLSRPAYATHLEPLYNTLVRDLERLAARGYSPAQTRLALRQIEAEDHWIFDAMAEKPIAAVSILTEYLPALLLRARRHDADELS